MSQHDINTLIISKERISEQRDLSDEEIMQIKQDKTLANSDRRTTYDGKAVHCGRKDNSSPSQTGQAEVCIIGRIGPLPGSIQAFRYSKPGFEDICETFSAETRGHCAALTRAS